MVHSRGCAAPRPGRRFVTLGRDQDTIVSTKKARDGRTVTHGRRSRHTLAGGIEVAAHNVADLDRRLGQIDSAIEEAAKRGKTNTTFVGDRRPAQGPCEPRGRAKPRSRYSALAALKAERASVAAKGRQIETEAAPIRYVAELVGTDTDSERAIRWLIALMVLCCDPLAIALTAAASARGRH